MVPDRFVTRSSKALWSRMAPTELNSGLGVLLRDITYPLASRRLANKVSQTLHTHLIIDSDILPVLIEKGDGV